MAGLRAWMSAVWGVVVGRRRGAASARWVRFDDGGVSTSEGSVGWAEVEAVWAYKQDCYTYDVTAVAMVDVAGVVRVCVIETDPGYLEFIEELPKRLEGCLGPEAWVLEMMGASVEVREVVLYRRRV